jgi:transposase-like protein
MNEVLELIAEQGLDGMADAYRILLNQAMKAERAGVLGAEPYQRSDLRKGYANGYKPKTIATRSGAITVQVPQARDIEFYPSALEKGMRSERALKLAVAEMYVQGVSTRKVQAIMQEMCGLDVSSSQVSRAAQLLDEELEKWRSRPLGTFCYLILDARYEKVRSGGSVVSCALLVAVGIGPDGKRSILGVSCKLSEAEVHWREFLASLQSRGLHGVQMIVSDDHAGLKAARQARFPSVPWQRCQFHLMQNAMQYVPKLDLRKEAAADIRTILDATDRPEAIRRKDQVVAKYEKTAPKLADWLESNVEESLSVLSLPEAHRKRLRTSNLLERINKEIKRRTRVATLFPNEASLLRLASAVLAEIDEEWQSAKVYLTMEEIH